MTGDDALPRPATIESLVGVYHADGSIVGELTYWVNARLGRAHCALCDITHGLFTEKTAWRRCREGLPVPFQAVHLDERDRALREFTEDNTPTVVARTDQGLRTLLGPLDLESLAGDPRSLADAIVLAATDLGLAWPT